MTRHIVVGVDGSPASERALVWAADAATRDDAQLLIAHGGDVLPKAELALDGGRDYSRDLLRDAVATAIDVADGSDVTTVLRDVQPAQLLLDLSNDAQLVVVGTHGKGRIVGVLLGSVAYRVAAHARCPVVVVPETWRARRPSWSHRDERAAWRAERAGIERGRESIELRAAELGLVMGSG